MTPAKSVLAAILLAAVGLSGPQLPQARSRSSQKYDRHASKNLPSRPLHTPAVGPSSMTPTPTTRATLRKSSHPTPFDVFCFRVRMVPCLAHISYLMITACLTSPSTAKCCFAAPYYYYPAYLSSS
ncbi:hypothetical protein EDB89DRAFT_2000257 [Lactarius sanguifluus]|nr:hypothetical protein EDB89DRAFT_2000257 [Lactarius sanguifluus]